MFLEIIFYYFLFCIYFSYFIILKIPFIKRILNFPFFKKFEKDIFRTPIEMIISDGYSIEIHNITTDDGYILTAWRIGK